MEDFPIHKNLDPSYKTDLDFKDCFRRENTHLIAGFHNTDWAILEIKNTVYSLINTVLT